MKKLYLLLLILPVLALSSCFLNKEEVVIDLSEEVIILEEVDVLEEKIEEIKEFTAYDGNKFSYIANGEMENKESQKWDKIENYLLYNNNLTISTTLYWPYIMYKDFDPNKVTYICNGTFLKATNSKGLSFIKDYLESGWSVDGYIKDDLRWQYCETNGEDYLKQFEFGLVLGTEPVVTGGEISYGWSVIYSKNFDGVNYFFSSFLKGEWFWVWDGSEYQEFCDSDGVCYDISSKEYLDIILEDEENQKNLAEWDKFVESLELVK